MLNPANHTRPLHFFDSDTREDSSRIPSIASQRLGILWDRLQAKAQLYTPDLGPRNLLARDKPLPLIGDVHATPFHPELATRVDEVDIVSHSSSCGPNPSVCGYVYVYVASILAC